MIEDYLENITDRCVRLLGENQNVEDFISAKITTCELYDRHLDLFRVQNSAYRLTAFLFFNFKYQTYESASLRYMEIHYL